MAFIAFAVLKLFAWVSVSAETIQAVCKVAGTCSCLTSALVDVLVADMSLATSDVRMFHAGGGREMAEARDGSNDLDFHGFGEDVTLKGGAGCDILAENGGNDPLAGGDGLDPFIFNSFGGDDVGPITDAVQSEVSRGLWEAVRMQGILQSFIAARCEDERAKNAGLLID